MPSGGGCHERRYYGPALRLLAGLLFDEADEDLVAPRIPLLAEKATRVLGLGRPTGG